MNKLILEVIKNQYILKWNGIHGIDHWMRVMDIGERLAQVTGADIKIVQIFAFFHDACRHSDGYDPEHGTRAAHFVETINDTILFLSQAELEIVQAACIDHSNGKTFHPDITVMTCWDADRLDLGRVGIMPKPERLCSNSGKDKKFIMWVYKNSRKKGD